MPRIRCAVVGCGRIAYHHIQALKIHSYYFDLMAVCDIDNIQATQLLSSTSSMALVYTDLAYMLSKHNNITSTVDSRIELVIIATPSGLHAAHTIMAAQAGCHVLTEKPLATQLDDGLDMIAACQTAQVQLFIMQQNRLNPTIKYLKDTIIAGEFGNIYSVSCNVFWTRPQSYYDQAAWRGTWELDGGALMNQASHYIDLLQWLIGPVIEVKSFIATLARNIEAEDSAAVILRYQHGALATLNVSMLTYPCNYEGSICIIGEYGTVKIGGIALNTIEHWRFHNTKITEQDLQLDYLPTSVYGSGHSAYYAELIKKLTGDNTAQIASGIDGLKTLEILSSIYLQHCLGTR